MSALCRKPCAVLTRHLVPRLQELQKKRYRKLHECPTTGFLQRSWRPTLTSTPPSSSLSPSSSSYLASLGRRILCNRLINNSLHYCYKSPAYLYINTFPTIPIHILTLIKFFFQGKGPLILKQSHFNINFYSLFFQKKPKTLLTNPCVRNCLKTARDDT